VPEPTKQEKCSFTLLIKTAPGSSFQNKTGCPAAGKLVLSRKGQPNKSGGSGECFTILRAEKGGDWGKGGLIPKNVIGKVLFRLTFLSKKASTPLLSLSGGEICHFFGGPSSLRQGAYRVMPLNSHQFPKVSFIRRSG
jgi:hypothetical protein